MGPQLGNLSHTPLPVTQQANNHRRNYFSSIALFDARCEGLEQTITSTSWRAWTWTWTYAAKRDTLKLCDRTWSLSSWVGTYLPAERGTTNEQRPRRGYWMSMSIRFSAGHEQNAHSYMNTTNNVPRSGPLYGRGCCVWLVEPFNGNRLDVAIDFKIRFN